MTSPKLANRRPRVAALPLVAALLIAATHAGPARAEADTNVLIILADDK